MRCTPDMELEVICWLLGGSMPKLTDTARWEEVVKINCANTKEAIKIK